MENIWIFTGASKKRREIDSDLYTNLLGKNFWHKDMCKSQNTILIMGASNANFEATIEAQVTSFHMDCGHWYFAHFYPNFTVGNTHTYPL